MKKYILILFLIGFSGGMQAQDLQTVISNTSKALKLDARGRINALQTNGHFIMNGTDARMPFRVIQAKPDKLRLETSVFGFKTIQTYDGKTAWSLNPAQGMEAIRTDVRDMEFIAAATAIDGPFSVNKNNKYMLRYEGEDTYQGKPVQVVSWNADNERLKYYINSENWLVDGVRYEYEKNGGWYSMEYRIVSYSNFLGSLFPGEVLTLINGVEMLSLHITQVKEVADPDHKRFGKPSYAM